MNFLLLYILIMNIQDMLHSIPYITSIYSNCEYGLLPNVRCVWKEKVVFYIHCDELQYYNYFRDYFDIINMLELNGIEISEVCRDCYCFDECDCEHHPNCKASSHIFGKCKHNCDYISICDNICECRRYKEFGINGKKLLYNGIKYICSYQHIREELKDVIDEILSNQKVVISEDHI